jgi:hypothetical protein
MIRPLYCNRVLFFSFAELPKTEVLPEISFAAFEALVPKLGLFDHRIVTCVTYFCGRAWLRFSSNVYNTKEDYVKLKDRLGKALKIK